MLCSASRDSTLKLWEARSGRMVMDLPGHEDEVYAVDWAPAGGTVASGGKDKALRLWKQ
jgi:ribosome assembly protein 4